VKKIAIIVTHPIQYYTPVFKLITERDNGVTLKVFFTWGKKSLEAKFDPGFKKTVAWDIPLLDGYQYEFLENTSSKPGSHHYRGINNPDGRRRICEFNPDVILIYGWAYQSHFGLLHYFKGRIPIWFRGDSTLLNEKPGWKKKLRTLFLKYIYKHIDKAFYVGTANKMYFLKHKVAESDLIFAPHAIDNNRFGEDRSVEAQNLRKEIGVSNDAILLLYAGKFEPVKNPLLLLQAFKDLNIKNVHLLFVGNGELEDSLKRSSCTGATRIHFMDFQNQSYMPVVYQACDLFCLPSKSETWGLAVNEVMAAGKAIIVSDKVGCAVDLVKDSNGSIFKSEDIEDFKVKLSLLCQSKEGLKEKGNKSKEIIDEWSFEKQVEAFENMLS